MCVCVLPLPWRLNSIKFSRAISRVKCLYWTDVSRIISVIIFRDLTHLMTTQMVLETSVQYRHLTQLIAREDFIKLAKMFSNIWSKALSNEFVCPHCIRVNGNNGTCSRPSVRGIFCYSSIIQDKRRWMISLFDQRHVRRCIQKFPDWPPEARTANGTALCHSVQLYRYFVSQSSEFCRHNEVVHYSSTCWSDWGRSQNLPIKINGLRANIRTR
jgi:hypothetical protein